LLLRQSGDRPERQGEIVRIGPLAKILDTKRNIDGCLFLCCEPSRLIASSYSESRASSFFTLPSAAMRDVFCPEAIDLDRRE
jgi:hypothetical protein